MTSVTAEDVGSCIVFGGIIWLHVHIVDGLGAGGDRRRRLRHMFAAAISIGPMVGALRSGPSAVDGTICKPIGDLVVEPVDMGEAVGFKTAQELPGLVAQFPETSVVAGIIAANLLEDERAVSLDGKPSHVMVECTAEAVHERVVLGSVVCLRRAREET